MHPLVPALVLALAGSDRSIVPETVGLPAARLVVDRGRATVVGGERVDVRTPVTRRTEVPGPAHVEVSAQSSARLAWDGRASLTLAGPAAVEFPAGPELEVRVRALSGASVEVRRGPLALRFPGGWELVVGSGLVWIAEGPGRWFEVRRDAGPPLVLAAPVEPGWPRPPIRVGAGAHVRIGPDRGFEIVAGGRRVELDPRALEAPGRRGRPERVRTGAGVGAPGFDWPWNRPAAGDDPPADDGSGPLEPAPAVRPLEGRDRPLEALAFAPDRPPERPAQRAREPLSAEPSGPLGLLEPVGPPATPSPSPGGALAAPIDRSTGSTSEPVDPGVDPTTESPLSDPTSTAPAGAPEPPAEPEGAVAAAPDPAPRPAGPTAAARARWSRARRTLVDGLRRTVSRAGRGASGLFERSLRRAADGVATLQAVARMLRLDDADARAPWPSESPGSPGSETPPPEPVRAAPEDPPGPVRPPVGGGDGPGDEPGSADEPDLSAEPRPGYRREVGPWGVRWRRIRPAGGDQAGASP